MEVNLASMTEVRDVELRSTGMSDMERCPRYFLFRHRAGLVVRGHVAPALQRGDMFHKIVANLLRGLTRDQSEQAAYTVMNEATAALAKQVSPSGYLPNGKTPEEGAKAIESNTRVAIAMSRAYARFFQVGPGTINGMKVLDGTIETKMSSAEAGTLDLVAVDGKNEHDAYVVDHKTCGWDPVQYARTLPLSAQTLVYPRLLAAFLLEKQHTLLRPVGICYNIIRTPAIRCCKTDDYNLTKYAKRVEEWYEENANDAMLRTFIRPSLELVRLSEARLDRARAGTVALPILSNFPATGGSACQAYNALCPFLGLCTRDTAGWPEELKRFSREWRDEQEEGATE